MVVKMSNLYAQALERGPLTQDKALRSSRSRARVVHGVTRMPAVELSGHPGTVTQARYAGNALYCAELPIAGCAITKSPLKGTLRLVGPGTPRM